MKQRYKQIYFADHPAESPQQKHLTLAFGQRDAVLYEQVKHLTSLELRERIGQYSFFDLQQAADQEGLALNTYCLRTLRLIERIPPSEVPSPGSKQEQQREAGDSFIDPIQATFRGGNAEPLHDWYPYLEGYSPEYVRRLLEMFAPHAGRILDPFAGTGTTPLTVSILGKQAIYCELNPLMQYLTEAKLLASRMTYRQRKATAIELDVAVRHLEEWVNAAQPDIQLYRAYQSAFSESVFF